MPFEDLKHGLGFRITPPTDFSSEAESWPMMSSSAYYFEMMIDQILAELWAVEPRSVLKHSIIL